ncbi:hypothetical protein [Nocardia brasiliensis]|uniref:hypothetical protein n=1 Tax=Nocardia brasiliensis TaxID=37326 RepID=UPI00366E77B9
MIAERIAEFDRRSLVLALQEITEELTADVPAVALPLDQDEAFELLAALLRAGGYTGTELTPLDETSQYAAATRVLTAVARDAATRKIAEPILADPPTDTRLGAELAVPALAVAAGVVGWLQTKVDLRIKRKDGKTEFEFRVTKDAASASVLNQLATAVLRMWNGPPQQ